ncbi:MULTISPECIES: methylenetetrahydrofolate reductase [NAD(P)H] [Nonomuraea]|uniref:Methylenetetrahydrofolate reductase n=1 Tax=Nonomuraea ferruginea TaxID=46174 RepID=A0ABT4SSW6_9ACTN|nr:MULTISPECIES: methylenetetrahydrofolate reductase [NAD(P)H] [Nonomuraea]MDA0639956.1 methylenetetrahydrofolate reductase [NAD(P)H] [Nonomuraea ferruginea]TXK41945.1 methylenetetrahydrofolate reductase [NAD(P)H] [Nonomuraea sp. C10]
MALGQPSILPGRVPTVRELLASGGRSFSFEFMPPKTDEGQRQLWKAIRELESLRPTFVSVTYGAGGSSRDRTVDIVERLAHGTTLTPVAHFTAVNHSTRELRHLIGRFADAGVRNILAVRGDPPGDPTGEWIPHPEGVLYAEDLVRLIRQSGDFCVGVAAFPYKHPRSPSIESDTEYFVRKCQAGADYAITQMFFRADDYLRLRDRVAARGCDTPIIPCVMPVTQMSTIARSEQLSGAPFPPEVAARFEKVADDPAAVRALGIEHGAELCQRLLDEGAPGIHFITFNRSSASREVFQRLRHAPALTV